MAGNMNLFIRKLGRAAQKLFFVLFILVILFACYLFYDKILVYLIHSHSFVQVYLGDKEYRQGKYQEAIDHYRKALELFPKHIKARYNLANIYVVYEDFPGAVEEYYKVLSYDPGYLNARLSLGIILSEEFLDFDKAIEEYGRIVNAQSNFVNIPFIYDNRTQVIKAREIAYYNMGLAYRDKSMLFSSDTLEYNSLLLKATDCYEKALKLNPNNYDAQYNLALTAHLLGLYTDALTGYCKAMLIAPLNYEAHFNLAILLKQKNMYKESFEEFKDAGSLVAYKGYTFQAAQIFSMLNEVSKMAIAEHGYEPEKVVKRLDAEIEKNTLGPDDEVTVNELEAAIKKRIKTASVCKSYLNGL